MTREDLPEIPPERMDDLHGLEWVEEADLILFVAGNQFMVMPELMAAFKERHPEIKRIFYETLPPRLELKQILAGGARFGGQIITARPDVYASVSLEGMKRLEEAGLIEKGSYFIYLHNRIVLMVREGNPKGIKTIADLGREDIRLSQPNPEFEDIAIYILEMYREAGGQALVRRIMEEKVKEGTTLLTVVHHRETPQRLVDGICDVGPVWATEVIEAQRKGLPFTMIDPQAPLDQRDKVNYYIVALKEAPHPEAARKFLDFIKTPLAQGIYARYGFVPEFKIG
ncbi:molybdate ABC transporter substrate-binding protein [Thermosulfuriphilus sp.]